MAGIVSRKLLTNMCAVSRRTIYSSTCVCAKKVMPESIDHATGLEKMELLAKAAGNENPFDMRVYKRTSGEASNPTMVPSFCQSRLVGCICHEDASSINWMWLAKGEPKRCECGFFFKLIDAKPMV